MVPYCNRNDHSSADKSESAATKFTLNTWIIIRGLMVTRKNPVFYMSIVKNKKAVLGNARIGFRKISKETLS